MRGVRRTKTLTLPALAGRVSPSPASGREAVVEDAMPEGQIAAQEKIKTQDTGLACLGMMLRFFHCAVDLGQLRHEFGRPGSLLTASDLVLCARQNGLLARRTRSRWGRLDRVHLPAIAEMKDGNFVVFARRADGDRLLIHDPRRPAAELKSREEIEATWDGGLILLTQREALAGAARRFDLSWSSRP